MIHLLKAFKAESIKLNHSGIKTTAYVLALLPMLISMAFSIYTFFSNQTEPAKPIYLFYDNYNQLKSSFIELFYPLIVIVTASRIAQLEHRNNTWQLMETQPINRAILLNAKFLKAYQICFNSIVIFMVGIVLSTCFGYLLSSKSELYVLNIDWMLLLKKTVSLTFGTGFLLALLYAISVRFSNLFISIIIGVGMLLIAPILSVFNLLPKWFPTTILSNSLKVSSDLGYWLTYNEYLSSIGMVLILFIITFWYVFKNRKWWITNKRSAVLNFAAPVLLLFGLFLYVNHPTQLTKSNETVIKGVVPENSMISTLYLLDGTMNDTLQTIPVKNKSFHHVINSKDLPLKKYRLAYTSIQGNIQRSIIFSKDDVVEVQFDDETKNKDFKILGTRVAENSLNVKLGNEVNYIKELSSEGSEENAEIITYLLKNNYNKDFKTVKKFSTADNFGIRDDYNNLIKNELYYKYNLIWLQYKDAVARKNENFKDKDKTIQDILNITFTPNEKLVAQAESVDYFRFKIYELLRNNTSDNDIIFKYQTGLQKINNPVLQTQMAKIILEDNLVNVDDLAELNRYETSFLPFVKETRAQKYYSKLIQDKKRLTTGNTALSFKAITVANQPKTFADFKGKYIVLDFWASWCGPCLYQADYFEKYAVEYKKQSNVVFISLSIDAKESAWRSKVKLNDKNVVQLFAINNKELEQFYRINSIPRFVVIDPEGKMVNSNFPFPSDSNFKIMLDQIIGKK